MAVDQESDNTSPDTEPDDDGTPTVDLDELADRVAAKLKDALGTGGGDSEPSTDEPEPGPTEPPVADSSPAPSASDPSVADKVKAEVDRVLGERDHAAAHERIAATAPRERLPRKGLGRLLWGA